MLKKLTATLAQIRDGREISSLAHAQEQAHDVLQTIGALNTASGGGVEFGYTATEGGKAASTLYLYLDNAERCIEFAEILHRALNTWEPEKRPEWAMDILDKLTGMPKQMVRPTPAVQGFERGDANDPSED